MTLKKQSFGPGEIAIFDDAVIYKRGQFWQMRMWLANERKYARFSLKTRSESTAIDKARLHFHELMTLQLSGKSYFSKTTKHGVEAYLKQRALDVEAGLIVKGRYGTIRTHLEHWLDFIGRDVKLKELERSDCENYFHARTKTKKSLTISQSTVFNEQCSINAMLAWLYKRQECYIDSFDFKALKRVDKGDAANRRSSFSDAEVKNIHAVLAAYIKAAESALDTDIQDDVNIVKAITGYFLGFALISGLRRGEQLQLRWQDVEVIGHSEAKTKTTKSNAKDPPSPLIKITVRGETSKVRKTRQFMVKDSGAYFEGLFKLKAKLSQQKLRPRDRQLKLATELMFSIDGKNPITARAIAYHFDKVMEQAAIQDLDKRDIVPYSFRHYFITQRVNSNLPPAAVAEMCGTSITQIEKTYYHTSADKMLSNALADYDIKGGHTTAKISPVAQGDARQWVCFY